MVNRLSRHREHRVAAHLPSVAFCHAIYASHPDHGQEHRLCPFVEASCQAEARPQGGHHRPCTSSFIKTSSRTSCVLASIGPPLMLNLGLLLLRFAIEQGVDENRVPKFWAIDDGAAANTKYLASTEPNTKSTRQPWTSLPPRASA